MSVHSRICQRKRDEQALTREEMINCLCLGPDLVVQIDFMKQTPDDHLRHAALAGLRQDKMRSRGAEPG